MTLLIDWLTAFGNSLLFVGTGVQTLRHRRKAVAEAKAVNAKVARAAKAAGVDEAARAATGGFTRRPSKTPSGGLVRRQDQVRLLWPDTQPRGRVARAVAGAVAWAVALLSVASGGLILPPTVLNALDAYEKSKDPA